MNVQTEQSDTTRVVQIASLSWSLASELVVAAIDASTAAGKHMTIAVVDAAGALKAFARMDGSPLLSSEIAQNKAYTAAAFGLPTDQWFDFIENDAPLRIGIVHTPRLVVFGGGYPVCLDGAVVGGIGVSGGHYTDDMAVAQTALSTLGLVGAAASAT